MFITTIIVVSFGFFFLAFYSYKNQEIYQYKEKQYQKIVHSYEMNLEKNLKTHYAKIAEDFVNDEVLVAIKNDDRAKLIELVKKDYIRLKSSDGYLEQFHFHRKDGTTLLRLHKIDFFDDDIAKKRAMLAKIHNEQQLLAGFELGIHGLSYRVIVPLFYDESYIGAFEIGISPQKVLDVVTYFNQIDGFIEISNNSLLSTNQTTQYTNLKDSRIIRYLPKAKELTWQQEIQFGEQHLSVLSVEMKDFVGKPFGKFVFFEDIEEENAKYDALITNLLWIFFLSIGIAFLVINFGFNRLISELENSYETLKRYTKLIDESVITSSTDLEGNITFVSQAFVDVSGYSKEELIGNNHRLIKHPDVDKNLYKEIWETLESNKPWSGEIKNRAKDGTTYWVNATISPVFDAKKRKIGYTAIRQNITDKKKLEEVSITDGLTGLFNRRYFNQIFPKLINSAKRKNHLIAMMMIDVDYFKPYNDNYGHQKGDEALEMIAKTIKNSVKRGDDMAFRLGGEEFGIVFVADDRQKALRFAEKVNKNIEEIALEHRYSKVAGQITASIGVVAMRAIEVYDKDRIYKLADDALYEAKKLGRNRVVMSEYMS